MSSGTGRRWRRWLQAAARRVREGFGPRAAVLMYHRIADDPSEPYGLCVAPRHFEEHLSVIRELGRPLRVAELTGALHGRSLPDRAICLTFDDGYADNLETAAPLLTRHGVPALVFMTTGAGGRQREFWWDELERIFLRTVELPASLDIEIAGRRQHYSLANARCYPPEEQGRHHGWHLLDPPAPTARHAVLRQIYHDILPLAVDPRTRVLDALVEWAGVEPGTVRADRRALQPEEVATLVAGGIVEVGAHTVNHPALPAQSTDAQRLEMQASRRSLEEWVGRPVEGFAYPYGFHDDVTVALARSLGFTFACAGQHRTVTRASDPHVLPRIEAPAGDGDALGRVLRRQFR